MDKEVMEAARIFFNIIKDHCDHNTVSATLFVNFEGFELSFSSKERQALLNANITMRNIKGEWV